MSSPNLLIELRHAELLYVAFSVVIQELERRTSYPTDNLWIALSAYEKGRDEYLHARGWSDAQRKEITESALEALTLWIDERTMKHAAPDFEAWMKELGEE